MHSARRRVITPSQQVSMLTCKVHKDQLRPFWRVLIPRLRRQSRCQLSSFANSSPFCAPGFLIQKRMRTTCVSLFRLACPVADLFTFSSKDRALAVCGDFGKNYAFLFSFELRQ